MERHHVVQRKYLSQWRTSEDTSQLYVYLIPQNEIIERGPDWKGFWRKDYNILSNEDTKSYLPEEITEVVDTKGLNAIRSIDPGKETQLSGEDRSALAFYIALQYIRTPRHREETNKGMHALITHFMRKDLKSPDDVKLTKELVLSEPPKNDYERKAHEAIKDMTDAEIRKAVYDSIHGEDLKTKLTNTGHSKSILKVDKQAKGLFDAQWLFLVAPSDTPFITSDNPCFAIAPGKILQGLLSPMATVIFPLRPDICVYIKPKTQSHAEHYLQLTADQVKGINTLILEHSYQSAVANDKGILTDLIRDFDHTKHKSSRDVVITEKGPYTFFNLQ